MARKIKGLQRVLDAPALFSVAYGEIASSIYFALGVVALYALGLTPVVLLVTGHHRSGEPPVHRGKIRAAVHDWLAASRHASRIAAVRGAHRRHGGGGSLYIILRR